MTKLFFQSRVSVWCSGQGVACTLVSRVRLLRHCFLYLCTFSFFSVWSFFNTTFPFGLFFLYSYCSPYQSSTRINIRSFILEKGFQKLEKLLICILAKLTTRKKHKLSRHVPPLKQLNFFFSMLVDIMTNNTQYTSTELIYTQHPLVTHWRKLNLPFVHCLNHQYYYPRISTGFAPKK